MVEIPCSGDWRNSGGTVPKSDVKTCGVRNGATKSNFPFFVVQALTVACIATVADSTIINGPKNVAVLKGNSKEAINLYCESDNPFNLKWYVRKGNEYERKALLYNGYKKPTEESYFTLADDEPWKSNLNVKNSPEAGQTYICVEPGTLAEASADLIMLSDLICTDSSTEDLVNITCSNAFQGNWPPTMEWKEHSDNGAKVLPGEFYTVEYTNKHVISTLVKTVDVGTRNYSCTIKFDINKKPPYTTATNVPDYNQTRMSPTFSKSQAGNGVVITTTFCVTTPFCVVLSLLFAEIKA